MEDMMLLGKLQMRCNFAYHHIRYCHLQAQFGEMAKRNQKTREPGRRISNSL